MGRKGELVFDPDVLSAAQRDGDACVACHCKWPRPRGRVGCLPNGSGVFACADCAPALPRAHGTTSITHTGRVRHVAGSVEAVAYR